VQRLEERRAVADVGDEAYFFGLQFIEQLDYTEGFAGGGAERGAVDAGGDDDVGV
jgi:hypothetical protein